MDGITSNIPNHTTIDNAVVLAARFQKGINRVLGVVGQGVVQLELWRYPKKIEKLLQRGRQWRAGVRKQRTRGFAF
jgi:hypothetical protein